MVQIPGILQKSSVANLELCSAHERIMLNITWRDRKTAIWMREQTGVRDILEDVSKLKWKWAGHVARMRDNRWTSRATDWIPRNYKRSRGRPGTRWRDDLCKCDRRRQRKAQDREEWQHLGKAYVQQRTGDD